MGIYKPKNKNKDPQLIVSRPRPPIGTSNLVVVRSLTILFMLFLAISLHMSVIYKPWKQEWLGKKSAMLEISIWAVCRYTVKGLKCYDGELDDAESWFLVFRWFLMISVIFQYIAVLFLMLKLLKTKNEGSRQFWIPAFVNLCSAVLILTAMLMLTGYEEFEFLENSRMYRMGWKIEQVGIESQWGWPYYLMWCNFGFSLFGCFICFYAHHIDNKWARWYATEGLRRKANQMIR